MGSALKTAVIGCGGLIALLVVVGIAGAIISGGSNNDTNNTTSNNSGQQASTTTPKKAKPAKPPAPPPSKPPSPPPSPNESTVALNQPVQVADATWVVTSAQRVNQLRDQFGIDRPKQGTFVVVNFTFTNNGSKAKTISQPVIKLVDSSGRTSDPDTDTFSYIPNDKDIFLEQVNPGVSKDGEVIFSVAPDASGFKLELHNTSYLKTDKAYVDLGF